ncbi:hypothetical protein ZEAMMB73_Zm00001d040572 [Zea mays]
MCPVQ